VPVEPTQSRPWLTRNLKVVSGVSFLQDTASELLYPILPIFLTVVLGAPAAVVGIVEGIAEGVAAIAKVVSGRVSDRFARRPLIGVGYGLAAVGKVLIALAATWPLVLAGRSVDRLGKGIRGAPRDALIAADVQPAARGKAFGFHRSMDTAGAVAGPLLGLAAYQLLDQQIRPLLWIAVIPAVLSVLLVLAIREPRRSVSVAAGAARSRWHPRQLPARYWRVVGVLTVFSVVNFPDALLLLRLSDIGFTVPGLFLAYVGYNAVYVLLSYPAGVAADRLPPAWVFAVGVVFFAVGYLGLGLTTNHLTAWLLLAAYGAFTALTDGVGKAWISRLVPDTEQGTAQGLYQGLTGLGVLTAGVWAGLAWNNNGQLPLIISGTTGLVLAVLIPIVAGRDPHPTSPRPGPHPDPADSTS
jgi:MFS family permease